MKKNCLCYAATLTLLAFVCGCSGPGVHQVKVTGKVTLDGKPLERGTIKFIADGGDTPSGGGSISSDGSYVAHVPPGKKKVLVTSYKVISKVPKYEGVPDSPMQEKRTIITPGIYNAAHRTPLEADITNQKEELNFDLVSSHPI